MAEVLGNEQTSAQIDDKKFDSFIKVLKNDFKVMGTLHAFTAFTSSVVFVSWSTASVNSKRLFPAVFQGICGLAAIAHAYESTNYFIKARAMAVIPVFIKGDFVNTVLDSQNLKQQNALETNKQIRDYTESLFVRSSWFPNSIYMNWFDRTFIAPPMWTHIVDEIFPLE